VGIKKIPADNNNTLNDKIIKNKIEEGDFKFLYVEISYGFINEQINDKDVQDLESRHEK